VREGGASPPAWVGVPALVRARSGIPLKTHRAAARPRAHDPRDLREIARHGRGVPAGPCSGLYTDGAAGTRGRKGGKGK